MQKILKKGVWTLESYKKKPVTIDCNGLWLVYRSLHDWSGGHITEWVIDDDDIVIVNFCQYT